MISTEHFVYVKNEVESQIKKYYSDRDDKALLNKIISSGNKRVFLPLYQQLREIGEKGDKGGYTEYKKYLERALDRGSVENLNENNYSRNPSRYEYDFLKPGTRIYDEFNRIFTDDGVKKNIREKIDKRSSDNSYFNYIPGTGPTGELLYIKGRTMLHQRRSSLESLNGIILNRYV